MNKWKKNCPKCGSGQEYKHKSTYNRAVKNGALCRSCACKINGKKFSDIGLDRIRTSNRNRIVKPRNEKSKLLTSLSIKNSKKYQE